MALVFLFVPMMIVSCDDEEVPKFTEEGEDAEIVFPITDVINTNLVGDIAVMGSGFDEATSYIFSRVQGQKHQINVGQTTLPETVKALFIDQKSFDAMDVDYLDQIYEWYNNGVAICMHKPEMWTAFYVVWHLRWKELGMDVSVAEIESKAQARVASRAIDNVVNDFDMIAMKKGGNVFQLCDIYAPNEVYTDTIEIVSHFENGDIIERDSVVTTTSVEPTPYQYGKFAEEAVEWLMETDEEKQERASRASITGSGLSDNPYKIVTNVKGYNIGSSKAGVNVNTPLTINVWVSTMYNFERDEDYYSVVVQEDFDASQIYKGEYFLHDEGFFGNTYHLAGLTWRDMEIRTRWPDNGYTLRSQYDVLPQGKASPIVTEEISGWEAGAEVSIGISDVAVVPSYGFSYEKKVTSVEEDVTLTNSTVADGNWMSWKYDFANQVEYTGRWGSADFKEPPTNATSRSQSYQNQSWKWVISDTRTQADNPFTFDLHINSMRFLYARTDKSLNLSRNDQLSFQLKLDENMFSFELPVPRRFKHVYSLTTDEVSDVREFNQLMDALRQVSTNFNSLYNKLIRLDDEGNSVGRTAVTYDALRTMVGQEWYALAKEIQGKKIAVEKPYKFYVIDEDGNKLNMVKLEKGEYQQVGTYLVIAPDGIHIEEGTAGLDEGDVFNADVNGFSLTFKVTKKNEECCLVDVPSDYKGELAVPSYVNSLKVTSVANNAAYRRSGITSLKIPNSVKTIGAYAFSGIGITSLELPENVLFINHDSFTSCKNLEKIVLPGSLDSVDYGAFGDCFSIKELHCKGKNPPKYYYDDDEFYADEYYGMLVELVELEVYEKAVLYVPKGCKKEYRGEWPWNKFKNIVEE